MAYLVKIQILRNLLQLLDYFFTSTIRYFENVPNVIHFQFHTSIINFDFIYMKIHSDFIIRNFGNRIIQQFRCMFYHQTHLETTLLFNISPLTRIDIYCTIFISCIRNNFFQCMCSRNNLFLCLITPKFINIIPKKN